MKLTNLHLSRPSMATEPFQPYHPEACSSPKDLRQCFGPKRRSQGFSTKIWAWLLPLIAALMSAKQSFTQGCASCYTTTAAGGTQTVHALRFGILILLIPPVVMFASLVWILWRWRKIRHTNRHEISVSLTGVSSKILQGGEPTR